MHENIDRILFTEDEIKQRVAEIGAGITQDYKDDPDGVILISVLRGAAIFMADLARQIQLPCEMDYMAVSSYGNGVKSSGVVRIPVSYTHLCSRCAAWPRSSRPSACA